MTPVELAPELGISDKTLRAWLRRNFPRAGDLHGTNWQLTSDQIEAARNHFNASGISRVWLFQANPKYFDLEADLRESEEGTEGYWTVTKFGDEMRAGDPVLFWQAGKDAGILAVGELTGTAYFPEHPDPYTKNPTERKVDFVYTKNLVDNPIRKTELLKHPVLKTLSVIQAPPGTNFKVSLEQWNALQEFIHTQPRWDEFIEWAKAFYERPDFEVRERTYKLQIADKMKEARRSAEERSSTWPSELSRAFGPPNNLSAWQSHVKLIDWVKSDPEASRDALRILWDESPLSGAIDAFVSLIPASVPGGKGVKTNLASVLLLARDPYGNPPFKVTPVDLAYRLSRFPKPSSESTEGHLYEYFLDFLDEFVQESTQRNLRLRDRLDAQSLMWAVTTYSPPEDWTPARRQALLDYRKGFHVGSELKQLVEEFLAETGYPTKSDQERHQQRAELAQGLTEEALATPDVKLFRRLGATAYGSPGPQPLFMSLVGTEEGLDRVAKAFSHLLHGEGSVADRFDQILDDPAHSAAGLKEAILTKCLAIGKPEEWMPCFVSKGPKGKIKMLMLLGLEPPASELSTGEIAVETNRRLYETLDPFFHGDPWGMQCLLWWLLHREDQPQDRSLATLAAKLLIDLHHLEKIERLLRDKNQIIFYGPPGTGKTYVARELAAHLAGRPGALEKVQFHPSYAYEDFVEGWRPKLIEGKSGFELKDGPLKRMARVAAEDPAGTYVLLIDEINRGNVAKIFGEMYFLLEYRDEEMALLYSEEPFTLPKNLLIIGTMNTADRSIALVDAALRRRFHFFPFFPDRPPIDNLLDRWLAKFKPELAWVTDAVKRANSRLGDSHNAIGPSHFMRNDLTEEWVYLIWEHSVLPYIAEQFFGEEQRLAEFELERLRKPIFGTDATAQQ